MYFLRKFDLAGIAIMISGSATPPFYYFYMCKEQAHLKVVFLGFIWVSSLIALVVSMRPNQKDFKNQWILAASFIAAGYSSLPGFLHLAFFQEDKYLKVFPVWIFFVGGLFYAGGAIIYALKWPEKQYPGRFDNFGNSHNIFHIFVVIGAIMCWLGSVRVFHERQLYPCPA